MTILGILVYFDIEMLDVKNRPMPVHLMKWKTDVREGNKE